MPMRGMAEMTFYNSYSVTILFDDWDVDSKGAFVWEASRCVGAKVEKYFCGYFMQPKRESDSSEYALNPVLENDFVPGNRYNVAGRLKVQVCLALYHILQLTLAYVLMLVVMTYNAGLFICVIVGSGLAFLLFHEVGQRGITQGCH